MVCVGLPNRYLETVHGNPQAFQRDTGRRRAIEGNEVWLVEQVRVGIVLRSLKTVCKRVCIGAPIFSEMSKSR